MSTDQLNPKITSALDGMLGAGFGGMLAQCFEQMEWAEDEITKAQRRHRGQADLMYHGFKLLTPTHELMGTRFVYESHCRELLDRLAAGQDTRPATWAEVACQLCDASNVAPLTETAAGLYARAWQAAGFPDDVWEGSREHYESLRGTLIDDLERETRRKLAKDDRRVTEIDCGGMHHGEQVNCTAALPKRLRKAA